MEFPAEANKDQNVLESFLWNELAKKPESNYWLTHLKKLKLTPSIFSTTK